MWTGSYFPFWVTFWVLGEQRSKVSCKGLHPVLTRLWGGSALVHVLKKSQTSEQESDLPKFIQHRSGWPRGHNYLRTWLAQTLDKRSSFLQAPKHWLIPKLKQKPRDRKACSKRLATKTDPAKLNQSCLLLSLAGCQPSPKPSFASSPLSMKEKASFCLILRCLKIPKSKRSPYCNSLFE